jgi:hypothetical protein
MRGLILGSRSLLFSVVVILVLCFTSTSQLSAEDVEVLNIDHSPKEPAYDGSMNVYLELENKSYVEKIEIFMCTMDPFICFFSDSMELLENGTFISITELGEFDLKENTTIGYNFEIIYKNATKEKIPNKPMEDDFDNILKINDEVYYLTLTLGEAEVSEKNGEQVEVVPYLVWIMMLIGLVVFVMIVLFLYKSRLNNGEKDT